MNTTHLAPYIVPLLVAGLMLRRASRARKIRPSRIWIGPAIFALLAAFALAAGPMPALLVIGLYAAAVVVGAGLGYLRARHQVLSIDPQTGQISSQATLVGTLLFLGIFVFRFGLKLAFPEMGDHAHANLDMTEAANGLLLLTVAMLATQAALLWNRSRPLLAAHAARTGDAPE